MAEYFCSWSGGADSTATALLALEHGEPLTALVYCEVMFDEHISGEVPEHAEFIHQIAIPWFENRGVQVETLRSHRTFMDVFWHQIKKGKRAGKYQGFPSPGFCKVQDRCKTPPLDKFRRANISDMQQMRMKDCYALVERKYLFYKNMDTHRRMRGNYAGNMAFFLRLTGFAKEADVFFAQMLVTMSSDIYGHTTGSYGTSF